MPLPPGTYPISGAIVLTGEKPAADATLWAGKARWIGDDGTEVIERTGSPGSYVYNWVVKAGAATPGTPSGDAEEALAGVRSNSDRLGIVERKTADLDIVSDGLGLIDAPAAEAGIAIFAATSTVGAGLIGGSRPLEAGDIASYSWLQSVEVGAAEQAIIVRIEGTLGPVDYYLEVGGEERPIHSYRKVLSDDTWDYFYLGSAESTQLEIKKRGEVTHTRSHAELAGRALEQVEGLIEDHEPDPSVTVDPPVWGLDASARTLLITIQDLMPTPALQAVDKIRLNVAGSLFITHDWNIRNGPRIVAFALPAGTALSNITNNAGSGVQGRVTFHATAGGNPSGANERLSLPFAMDAVAPEDVPTPGGVTTLVEHPRVFHANAISTPDPDDSTRVSVDFSPNEGGLTPVANSLFTFVWNVNPGFAIYRTTMAPRGTPSADATVVALTDRNSGSAAVSVSDALVRGTTYLARYAGTSIVILTALQNDAAAANLLIDDSANPIAATAANRDKILYRAGRLYGNEPIHYADPTATYRDFATADLPAGYSWGGAVQVSPGATAQPDNRVIYSIPGGHFLRKVTGAGQGWWVNYSLPNWRGPVADQSAADHAVRAAGDVVFFGGKVQVAATYSARTADQWHWVPLEKRRFNVQVGASPATLPEGTEEIFGYATQGGRRFPFVFPVDVLPSAEADVAVEGRASNQDLNTNASAALRCTYTAATRRLVYAMAPSNDAVLSQIRARGEA